MALIIQTKTRTNDTEKDFVKIIEYTTKAPSGHNSQPWLFKTTKDYIDIFPDFSKSLPIVDENNKELYMSLGCAAENLCIAANHFGYYSKVETWWNEHNRPFIRIHLSEGNTQKNDLFEQIEKRQTNRSVYSGRKISMDTIDLLKNIDVSKGLHIRFYKNESTEFQQISHYIQLGNKIQMSDKLFKKELLNWMRFNNKELEKECNGLSYKVMGSPSMPSFIGKPMVKMFLKPDIQNKNDLEKINSSSHLVLITVDTNHLESWINAGRLLERFLLKTTQYGISAAFMNQACEIEALGDELMKHLNIQNETASIILRIGYADKQAVSPRKEVQSVILN